MKDDAIRMGSSMEKMIVDESLLVSAMDTAQEMGARYADIRLQTFVAEDVAAENGDLKAISQASGTTVGIRALSEGSWGFASKDVPSLEALNGVIMACLDAAVRNARAADRFGKIELAEVRPVKANIKVPMKRPPADLETKKAMVMEVTKAMKAKETVMMAVGDLMHEDITKHFCSTEGALIVQESMRVGGELLVNASGPGGSQTIWKPFGAMGGWEFIDKIDPMCLGLETAERARRLVTEAKAPESRETTVVTRPDFNMLKVHEIVGHPVEADRVLGGEAAWAGRAWWKELAGTRVGSGLITAVSDARPTEDRLAGFYGTFAYYDEGVPGQRVVHIERGVLKDFLHSRQTAAIFGTRSSGAMRANHAGMMPIIRMTNTFFESDPEGPNTLDDMIGDIKDGILLGHQSIPSIDSRRFRFQINAYEGWEIKKGEVGPLLKNVALIGNTSNYLRSIYRVGGPKTWQLFQLPNCGKGDPMQIMRVGNGGPLMAGQARILGVA